MQELDSTDPYHYVFFENHRPRRLLEEIEMLCSQPIYNSALVKNRLSRLMHIICIAHQVMLWTFGDLAKRKLESRIQDLEWCYHEAVRVKVEREYDISNVD